MIETKGVQLAVIIEGLDQHGWVIDWMDFLQQSLDHGWNPKSTLSKIEEALLDIKGPEYTQEVLNKSKQLMGL